MRIRDKIFSDNEINVGRQKELDLARAFIIFCLALIHVAIECSSDEALTSGIPYLFDTVIGGPFSAPMYMFVMGLGMVYTTKNTPYKHFVRGLKIFILGYLLNVCRFVIPYSIGYAITGEYATYIEPLIYKALGNDILVFGGVAMMAMAFFIKLKLSNVVMLIIATIMCAFGTLLNGVDIGSPMGNIFLGYLIGTEDAAGMVLSDFPLLNWMMFPVCGYVFGSVLKKVKDKKLFYLTFSVPAIIIAIMYFTYGIYFEKGMFGEGQNCYYHMIFSDVLASLLLTIGLVGVYYGLLKVIPKRIESIAVSISGNITSVYCIHWVLVSFVVNVWMYIVRGTTLLTSTQIVALGSAISIASIVIAHYFRKFKERGKINAKIS